MGVEKGEPGFEEIVLGFFYSEGRDLLAKGAIEEVHHSTLQPEAPLVQNFDHLPVNSGFSSRLPQN